MNTGGADYDSERNKSLIESLYDKVYNGRDLGLIADIFSPDYVEHNPDMESGGDALSGFLRKVFGLFPSMTFTLARLVAEGDFVVAHALMRRSPDDRGTAIAEIFRCSDGKVLERWDVSTPIPETNADKASVI